MYTETFVFSQILILILVILLYPYFQVLELLVINCECEKFQRDVVISSFSFTPPPRIITIEDENIMMQTICMVH